MTREEAMNWYAAKTAVNERFGLHGPQDEAALRAQPSPAKLDRERWEGCGLCKKASRISGSAFVHYGHEEAAYDGLTFSYMKYCPCCGRPLTEEAWAELERKIGGNDGKTDI